MKSAAANEIERPAPLFSRRTPWSLATLGLALTWSAGAMWWLSSLDFTPADERVMPTALALSIAVAAVGLIFDGIAAIRREGVAVLVSLLLAAVITAVPAASVFLLAAIAGSG